MQEGWTLTNDWWRWDVIQFSWQPVASLPATPRQYATAQSIDGIGFLFGGSDASAPLNELWAYDTDQNTWSARSSLPSSGRYASASFVANGKLYVVGGLTAGGTALNELWAYDPVMDTWAQLADLPGVPRHRATAASTWFASEEHGIVVGGADEANLALDEVWRYAPSTDSWVAVAPFPEARFGASSAIFIDQPLIMAGTTDNSTFHSDGYLYYAFTDTWEPFGEFLPSGRRGGVMGFSHACSGYYFAYYGTGLDQDLVRHNDWFGSGSVFGMEEGQADRLTIFPNPTSDRFSVSSGVPLANATYSIMDALGRIVGQGPLISSSVIQVEDLAPGKYEVSISERTMTLRASLIKLP